MRVTYSASEARTRFSEVLRRVREGETIVVTYRGEPVAEIRPLGEREQTLGERTMELERRGVLVRAKGPRKPFKVGKPVPGALERFLAERGRPWES